MPAAANLTSLKMVGADAAPGAAPGAPDAFAALVAAIAITEGDASDGAALEGDPQAVGEAGEAESDAVAEAAILLPMLDQQRAVAPAAVVVTAVAPPAGALPARPAATAQSPTRAADPVAIGPAPGREASEAGISPHKEAPQAAAAKIPIPDPAEPADKGVPGERPMAADTAVPGERPTAAPPRGGQAPAHSPSGPVPPQPAPPVPVPATGSAPSPQVAGVVVAPSAARPAARSAGATAQSADQRAAAPHAEKQATGISSIASAAQTAPPPPAAPLLPEAGPERAAVEQAGGGQPARDAAPANPFPATAPVAGTPAGPAPAPAANIGAAIAAQVLDLAKGGEWINEVARDIARSAASDGTMRFRLAPETLGELRVEITHSERGAHVRLQVTSEAAQQALAEAQPKLVQEARAQGVRIAEAEVSLAGGQSNGRDASRQAPGEQPMRSFRPAPQHHSTSGDRSEASGRGRTDLYA